MKNLKITLMAALFLIGCNGLMAQSQYEKGQIDANLGIGLGTVVGAGAGLPVSLAVDFGITDNISVGGYLGYVGSSEDYPGNFIFPSYTVSYTNIIAGVRGAYHLELVDGIDTYGGVLLGYNIASSSIEYDGNVPNAEPNFPTYGGVTYSFFAGGRYHFTDNIGVFAELGYGIAWLQLGLTAKF